MRWVTCHKGQLQVQADMPISAGACGGNACGPGEAVPPGTVHEFLFDSSLGHPIPMFPALFWVKGIATAAADETSRLLPAPPTLIWCDPGGVLFPPAVHLAGVPVDRLRILRPRNQADAIWAVRECLQSQAVGAVVAQMPARLSRVEARRLQLAAERGNGVGLFLRPLGPGSDVYAAHSRWLVAPARGERDVQRWDVRLVYGHGRHLGQSFLLEKRRGSDDANLVHLPTPLADRPALPAAV
jgi:hypothetical protein